MKQFCESDLLKIQEHFHALIRERNIPNEHFDKVLKDGDYVLPVITNDNYGNSEYSGVPGMYGGFKYELYEKDGKPVLESSSWYRIVGGSGQRHEITVNGIELIEEGFV